MKILKRKTLAALLALSLLASILPLGAQPALATENVPATLLVGGTDVKSGGYWTTDTDGKLTNGSESSWNVHYDASANTLYLNGATITASSDSNNNPSNAGIYATASEGQSVSLNIVLQGENNKVSGDIGIYVYSSSTGDASLTITGDGNLTASGTVNPGIWVQSNGGDATLTIQNADVTAENSSSSGDGVLVQAGQSSNASLSVNGGSLTATGSGTYGVGIRYTFGSGSSGSGKPSLTVSNNAIVRANSGISDNSSADIKIGADSSGNTGGIVFDGGEGTVYGDVTLQENITINEGESLTIPNGSSLNTDGKLTVDGGTLTGDVTGTVIYKVADVSLNKTSLTLTDGGSETLTATITPSNATNKNVTWSSSAESVATVDNSGKVTAVGAGTAQITVTTEDGNKTATCTVTVTAKTYSLSVDPATLDFGSITEGEARPAAQEVTITNTGNQTVTLVQPTATNFEITTSDNLTLNAGESVTLTIQPKANLPRGSYSEQITISGNDGASVTLTATFTVKEPPYTGKYSYEVSTSVGDHGSLTVDRYATEGEKVTITVTPDEAYKLDDLSVTAGGKEVALTAGGDGTYTFTMPSADVKISATFAEDPDWTEPEEPATDVSDIFLDIAPNAWYKDAVQYAYDSGLMTGVSANEFAPEATTTRGHDRQHAGASGKRGERRKRRLQRRRSERLVRHSSQLGRRQRHHQRHRRRQFLAKHRHHQRTARRRPHELRPV